MTKLVEPSSSFDGGASESRKPRLVALTRMSEAEAHPAIQRDYPVIAQSLQLAASPQLRNMASLGGNVLQRTRCAYWFCRDKDGLPRLLAPPHFRQRRQLPSLGYPHQEATDI